ncbi:MAG: serine protease [Acidobacteriota bacterium]
MRRISVSIILALFCGVSPLNLSPALSRSFPGYDDRCRGNPVPMTEVGERKELGIPVPAAGPIPPIVATGARYLRILIRAENPSASTGECNWILTVRDGEYRLVQTLTATEFMKSAARWTNRITGPRAILELKRCPNSPPPQLTLEEYIVMPEKAKQPYYSSTDRNNPQYQGLYFDSKKGAADTRYRHLGDYVGFLMGSSGTGLNRSAWCCSGVVVAPDLFLTNWHCGGPGRILRDGVWRDFPEDLYWNNLILRDTLIDLSWDDDGLSREFITTKVELKSKEFDFALLRIAPVDYRGEARPAPISLEPPDLTKPISIVHHAECLPKQITIKNCRIVNAEYKGWRGNELTDFTHSCDTEGGSSGGPVFDSDGRLIGLHHIGYEFSAAPACKPDGLNKAVWISKIFEWIRQQKPDIADSIMKQQ